MSRIAIIGTGYVGLTTGAYLSHLGHDVVCADVVAEKVAMLNRGEIPIYEAGLDELVKAGLDGGRLSFVLGAAKAAAAAEFVFLCVQTPQGEDGSADLSYIQEAAREIAPVLEPETIVINKSTVPVGSTRVVERALGRSDIFVVSNPEFLREGSAVHDCLHPDRIVIGSDDQAAAARVAGLFDQLQAPLIVTDPASAETIKYASNAFLATKISFVNAMANVCEAVGADVREVVLGMGYDKRIGFEFLKPGPGWGGSCLVGDETVLVRHGEGPVRLLTLEALFAEVEREGPDDWWVQSWYPEELTPEFLPVAAFTSRSYQGDVVEVRTKMGRRVITTVDHLFVVGDGSSPSPVGAKRADELTERDWLPVAQNTPVWTDESPRHGHLTDALPAAQLTASQVILRLGEQDKVALRAIDKALPAARRWDTRRSGTLRLSEAEQLGLALSSTSAGTTTNGTYVPLEIPLDIHFWRMVGLWLAEGHISTDGARKRVAWSFHPTDEPELVAAVADYWKALGVKVSERRMTTAFQVSISSRLLAGWFEHVLGLGTNCYDKRIPDLIWTRSETEKRSLLAGLWDGDGSWSAVRRGPNVVLEYGTTSRMLADGMLRLLGDLGVTARLKVGRTTKSTCDTYWLVISGGDQIENCLWLVPEDEQDEIRARLAGRSKRIAPTGYRSLSKGASWVRVTSAERRLFDGTVYSLEVPGAHTFVTTHGLIVHNCFPKDSRALVRIAEDAGYDFGLLKGVITVNTEQYERVANKIEQAVGGSLAGATIAVLGLTFKARTNDLRDSPALEVIGRLRARGATAIKAYDPTVTGGIEGVEVCADAYGACEGANVLAVLTEWDDFRWLDFDKVLGLMANPSVVDARNLLDPAALRRRGFSYVGVGR